MAVPIGCQTTTVFGWVHQNMALAQSVLSTIALLKCSVLLVKIDLSRLAKVAGFSHVGYYLGCLAKNGKKHTLYLDMYDLAVICLWFQVVTLEISTQTLTSPTRMIFLNTNLPLDSGWSGSLKAGMFCDCVFCHWCLLCVSIHLSYWLVKLLHTMSHCSHQLEDPPFHISQTKLSLIYVAVACVYMCCVTCKFIHCCKSTSLHPLTSVNVRWQRRCHILNECPLTMLSDGGLQKLCIANDDAVNWLEWTEMKALAKWNEIVYWCSCVWLSLQAAGGSGGPWRCDVWSQAVDLCRLRWQCSTEWPVDHVTCRWLARRSCLGRGLHSASQLSSFFTTDWWSLLNWIFGKYWRPLHNRCPTCYLYSNLLLVVVVLCEHTFRAVITCMQLTCYSIIMLTCSFLHAFC